jgi:phosphoglycolate phosphatase-like HAD superfamily hydrolase
LLEQTLSTATAILFDFDGTVALVRAGWMPLMLDFAMETLGGLGPDPAALRAEAEDYIARLTGKDTVFQMTAFADHVRRLGGVAKTGEEYKVEFMERLNRLTRERLAAPHPERLLVPGTAAFLKELRAAGKQVYLASGSAHAEIVEESKLLGIAPYFHGIYGSAPGIPNKRELLQQILASGIPAGRILTFGDGRVEIEETKAIGGMAVGVATDEEECLVVDAKKEQWLREAGADYIIPNYLDVRLRNYE